VSRQKPIIGIGVDVVEIKRIKNLIIKNGIDFLKKIYTENEISYCQNKKDTYELFATSYAVKEAVIKALGTGLIGKMEMTDIEVHFGRRPTVETRGDTLRRMRIKKADRVLVSYTYTHEFSLAKIILT
jgi:holo-[acyl-carrier protein] synthase